MATYIGNTYIAGGTVNVSGTATTTTARYTWTSVAGTVVGGTVDATIIASPGGGTALCLIDEFVHNNSGAAGTVTFKSGTVPYRTLVLLGTADHYAVTYAPGAERVLAGSAALALAVSAGTIDYAFRYRTVT